jgi:urease accessory protein
MRTTITLTTTTITTIIDERRTAAPKALAPPRGGGPQGLGSEMNPAALLGLLRLASPALPVGGFSYSEGLEAAVEANVVHDEGSALHWLRDQLHLGLARSDLPLVASAHEAWTTNDSARIAELNTWMLITRESRELRAQTEQMGRSMLEWLRQQTPDDARVATLAALAPSPTWPIAFALAAAQTGATAHDSVLAYGFSWAENQVQAALKSVPLGQSAGQRILAQMAQELAPLARISLTLGDDQRQAFAPLLAIRSSQHETQYSRLFRS